MIKYMDKMIRDVFLILGVLVFIFIAWQLVFAKNDGILVTTYNSIANTINKTWSSSNGATKDSIMPTWNSIVVTAVEPSDMFEIYN